MTLEFAKDGFEKCVSDAMSLINVASSLPAKDRDTALRGSLMLLVGAFDFFIHEVIRVEIGRRIADLPESLKLQVPLNFAAHSRSHLMTETDLLIRKQNSFRSFVGSKNIKECFSSMSLDIWSDLEAAKGIDAKEVRKKLDVIWSWRNRIAHEGDLVPSNLTFAYWEIYSDDVIEASKFLVTLATDIADVVESSAR